MPDDLLPLEAVTSHASPVIIKAGKDYYLRWDDGLMSNVTGMAASLVEKFPVVDWTQHRGRLDALLDYASARDHLVKALATKEGWKP